MTESQTELDVAIDRILERMAIDIRREKNRRRALQAFDRIVIVAVFALLAALIFHVVK